MLQNFTSYWSLAEIQYQYLRKHIILRIGVLNKIALGIERESVRTNKNQGLVNAEAGVCE